MATTWDDDYDPEDDWDDYESPEEYEGAQLRAEEPPDSYFEEEAERQHQRHRDDAHFGEECNCPPPPTRCRLLLRIPRWAPRKGGWRMGTPGLCDASHRSLLAALGLHRSAHEWDDEPPF